jgi:hypothetical protein
MRLDDGTGRETGYHRRKQYHRRNEGSESAGRAQRRIEARPKRRREKEIDKKGKRQSKRRGKSGVQIWCIRVFLNEIK